MFIPNKAHQPDASSVSTVNTPWTAKAKALLTGSTWSFMYVCQPVKRTNSLLVYLGETLPKV